MRILRVELHSCREDNERMLRDQEEQNQLNVDMFQILTNIQTKINHGKNSEKRERVGVAQGCIPTRGPIVQGFQYIP